MSTRFFSRFVSRRVAADRSFFKKKSAPGHRRRLQLESLETRAMLATFASGEWGWAGTLGAGTSINSMCTDSSGAVVVSGTLSGSCDVDPGEGISTLVSAGGTDAFVAKYTSAGALLWARSFGGTGNEQGLCVAVDSRDDSLLVGGAFSGVVDFDPGPQDRLRTSAGYYDAYMSKFGSDGSFQWVGTLGSNRAPTFGNAEAIEYVNGMDVDADGNIFATGMFNGNATARFGAGSAALVSGGPQNTFILEVQPSGNLVWAKQFYSTFLNGGAEIKVLPSGRLAVRGGFHTYSGGPPDFDPGAGTAYGKAYGYADAYLALLERNGDYVWSSSFGTSSEDGAAGLAVDADGFLYLVGSFGGRWGGTIDLDPGAAAASFTAEGTNEDIFVVKLSPTGGYVWGRRIGGTATEQARTAKISPDGKLVIAGVFSGTVDFDPGPGQQYQTSAGGFDGFLLTLDSADGSLSGVERFGGVGDDLPAAAALAFGPAGQAYLSGAIPGAVDFSQGAGVTSVGAATGTSGFVWKFEDLNVAPTAVALTATTVTENQPAGTFIGELSTTDLDSGDTFTYSLVSGTGSTDNAQFAIVGNQLKTVASFNYEAKGSYSIRVRSADAGGLSTERAFTISVADVRESPAIDGIGNVTVPKNSGQALISLSGIRAGDSLLPVRVTAVSSDPSLVPSPTVDYVSRTFTTATTISTGVQRTHGVAVGDFNGDGKKDIAANSATNGILRVTYGDGVGGFSAPVSVAVGYEAYFVVADDFNSDGIDDVAVSNFESNLLTVRLGSRSGTFGAERSFASGNGTWWPDWTGVWYLATGDFNADGRRDIVSCNIRHDFVATYLGDGAGGFGSPIKAGVWGATPTTGAQDGPYGVVVKDFNRDGKDDVAVAVMGDNTVRVLLGNGSGGLAVSSAVVVGPSPRGLTAGDFDNDGLIDLAATNTGDGTVTIVRGDGAGGFVAGSTFTGGVGTIEVAAADLDRDGNVELVTSSSQGQVFRLRGRGNGTFGTPEAFVLGPSNQQQTFSVIKDINGDSFPDIASIGEVWNQIPGDIDVLLSQPVTTGSLSFAPVAGKSGTATVTVTVEDAGPDGNLATVSDNNSVVRTFTVTVTDPNSSPSGTGVPWTLATGGNGHSYELVQNSVTWSAAKAAAEARGGYLATITSAAEQAFVESLSVSSGVWLGGYQDHSSPAYSEPHGGWRWVTNEPWSYSNWAYGEPNNLGGEDWLEMSYYFGKKWNDLPTASTQGFIVEFEGTSKAPTDIAMSPSAVPEISSLGTVVGTLSTTDPDAVDTFTYSLVSGTGDTDNAAFTIVGGEVRTATIFNYETKSNYSIRVRSTDAGGLSTEKVFAIAVTNVNEVPTGIALTNASIAENQPSGTTVGMLSTADPDNGDTFTYSLMAGNGDIDNGLFTISGNRLQAAASFNYEAKNVCRIRVRTTDSGGLYTEEAFAVTVVDTPEGPTALALSNVAIPENRSAPAVVGYLSASRGILLGNLLNNGNAESGVYINTPSDGFARYSSPGWVTTSGRLVAERYADGAPPNISLTSFGPLDRGDLQFTGDNYPLTSATQTIALEDAAGLIDAGSAWLDLSGWLGGFETHGDNAALSVSFRDVSGTQVGTSKIGPVTAADRGRLSGHLFREALNQIPPQTRTAVVTLTMTRTDGLFNNAYADALSFRIVGRDDGELSASDLSENFTYAFVAGDGDTDNAAFEIVGNALFAKVACDYETKTTYTVRVRCIDASGFTIEKPFTFHVTNLREAPTGISLTPGTVAENMPVGTVVGTFSTTDPDVGDTFTYSLVAGTGSTDNAQFAIVGGQLKARTFDYEATNAYSVRVRTTDAGGLSADRVFVISVANVNEAPTSVTLSASTVAENQALGTSVGTLSTTDQDAGDAFTYTLVSGMGDTDNGSFEIVGGVLKTKAVFDYETKSSYTIRVRTTDGGGLSTEQSFTITIVDTSDVLGLSTSVVAENAALGSVVATITRNEILPDLTPLAVYYVPSSGQMVLVNTTAASLAIQSVQILSPVAKMSGATASLPAEASFTTANTADGIYGIGTEIFFANLGTAALTLAGGGAWDFGFVADVGLTRDQILSSFSTDPEVDVLPGSSTGQFLYSLVGGENVRGLISYGFRTYTYSLVPGIGDTDNALFSIEGTSLKVAGGIDYEAKSHYAIRVRSTAQDGTWIEEVLSVDATDVNEAPTAVSLGSATSSLNENTSTASRIKLADVAVTDDALGTNTLSLSGADAASFEIVGTALYLKAGVTLDYETKRSYAVTVQASDAILPGSTPASQSYTLTVANVNEAPTGLGASPTTVAENQPIGTTIGTLSTTDPDSGDTFTYALVSGAGDTDNGSFEIAGNALKAKASFNYEAKSSYSVRVRTTDAGGLFTEQQLTVTVTDVNESPTAVSLTNATASLAENTSTSSRIKLADIVVTDDALGTNILSLSGADASSFEIVGTALYLKSGVGLDFETKVFYAVTVSVADSGMVGPASVHTDYTLGVTNVNEAPTNVALSPSTVAENQAAGASVGTLSTTDQDAGDTFTYTLVPGTGATDNGSFVIVGNTLKTAAAFDYETKSSYTIRVRTTDAGGLFTDKAFTIAVTDVNDAPTNIALSASTIAENQPAGTTIGSLSTTDQDSVSGFTYSLIAGTGDTDNASFEIVGGTLKTRAALNYETKSSYTIRVRTTDADGLFTEKQFTIGVTDVNEAPTAVRLVNAASSLPENTSTAGRLKVADIVITDDALGSNTVSLLGSDKSFFEIDGLSLYLKAGTALDYGLKTSYDVVVDAADASAVDVVATTPLTVSYGVASGSLTLRNTTAGSLALESVSILSPTHALSGVAAALPPAAFITLNTSDQGLYGLYSEIFFGNVGSAALTLAAGGTWNLGNVAQAGLTSAGITGAFGTDADADPEGSSVAGRFIYSTPDGSVMLRGAIVCDISAAFTLRVQNVPEYSGREYAEVAAGQTLIDTTARTGSRQVIVRGGGTLVLAGANTNTGGVKVEGGTLVVRNASALGTGTLDVRAGGVVNLDVGYAKATVGGLTLASGAKINLGTGGLQIAAGGTTLDALRSAILLARNGGVWNGTSGIGSASVDVSKSKVVGYRQMPSGAYQVAWAAYGDTNLDGRVNSTDINALNSARKFGLSTRDSHWSQGDFSYDGRVNSTDIQLLSAMFGKPSYYTTASPGTVDAPVASITAQLFAALAGVDPDGDGKL